MRSIEHPFANAKREGPFASRSRSKRAKRADYLLQRGGGVQSIPVSRMRPGRASEHAAIRKTVAEWLAMIGLDLLVRHAFTAQDQGNPHLQKNGESSRSPTPPRPHKDREYGPLSRDRGGRCACSSR